MVGLEGHRNYVAFGLSWRSCVALPFRAAGAGRPDVVIRFGEVPASLPPPARGLGLWQSASGAFLLRVVGLAHFYVRNGREILIAADGGDDRAGGDECVSNSGTGHDLSLLLRGRWRGLLAHLRAHNRRPSREVPRMLISLLHPKLAQGGRFWRLLREGRLWSARSRNYWLIAPQFAQRVPANGSQLPAPPGVRQRQLHRLRNGLLSERMEREIAQGARFGLEYRYPLLDRRLVEFALSLPPEVFCGPPTRFLMRCAVSGLLPKEVCWNEDKTDPQIHATGVEAFALAMPALRRALLAPEAPLTRAGYVDMRRLLERLGEVEEFRRRPRPLPIVNALTFLDF